MAVQYNNRNSGASRFEPRGKRPEGYAHGNSNWNTSSYKQSVRTSRTDTRVINSGKKRNTYYYDNTPAAVKARQKKRFEERKRAWQKAVKKNLRGRRLRSSTVYITSFILAIAVILGVIYYLFFTTSNITVTGASSYTEEEVISASGLTPKTHLYSFSSKSLSDKVSFACPRISLTEVERNIPNKVTLSVSEEKPAFYTVIYGEIYLISPTLRVLEKTDADSAQELGLGKLKLNKVSGAVSGRKLELCSERAQRYLENTVAMINSSELNGRVNCIDMTDEFNISMTVDGLYKLEFGPQEEMDIKIRIAAAVLKDPMFESGNKAYIDLTDTSKTSVIVDNQLVLD